MVDPCEKTVISATNENAIKRDMTSKEVLDFLENGALYRSFKDVIYKVYPNENVNKVLTEKIYEMFRDYFRTENISNMDSDKIKVNISYAKNSLKDAKNKMKEKNYIIDWR